MKFKSDYIVKIRVIETEHGVTYRTDMSGETWERLYGESWEPVFFGEEDEVKEEFVRYFHEKHGDCEL